MGDLLDVVYQGEQLPLRIDLALTTQRKASHALVLEVGEHRFHDGDALIIGKATLDGVELAFHLFHRCLFPGFGLADEDRDLLGFGGVGGGETAASERARAAHRLGAPELHPEIGRARRYCCRCDKVFNVALAPFATLPVLAFDKQPSPLATCTLLQRWRETTPL